jgi:hypothetical protein
MSESKWQCNYDDHINKFSEQTCEICGNHRPVIVEFTYHILEEFGTIKVSWSIENFKKGNLKFGRKNIDITDSKSEIILKEIRHRKKIVLYIENDTCEITEDKIILLKEPEILNFNSNILKVLENSFIDLTWDTKNATNVTISTLGSVSSSGFIKSTKPKSSFKIIAENEVGKTEQELKIEVVPLPSIKEYRVKQQKIEFGKETELVWDIENIENVELHYSGIIEILSKKGSKVISPTDETNYKIITTALDGITKEEKSVNVQVFKRVEIETFSTDNEFIVESLEIELNWKINNASSITLCSNIEREIDVTGTNKIILKPKRSQYFYLKATNDLFSVDSNKINIEVQNLPTLPRFENIIPTGKDLIPVFNLDFSENVNRILSESQKDFQKAVKKQNRFSLLNNYFKK